VIAISVDSPEDSENLRRSQGYTFPILSDENLQLTRAMRLPVFRTSGMTLLKRFVLRSMHLALMAISEDRATLTRQAKFG